MNKIAAVIVAGGSGKRMGTSVKKQYIKLDQKEILAHTIEAFETFEEVDEIVVVVGKDDINNVNNEIILKYGYTKVKKIVSGGTERQDSVYNGLLAVSDDVEYVMIHDGARPFVTKNVLERAVAKTIETKATIVAVPVKDTIKQINNLTGAVEATPKREILWAVQTPQSFNKQLLLDAYAYAKEKKLQVTDDSMIIEAYGHNVYVVEGDYTNIKITTSDDLMLGKSIIEERKKNK